jgi:O-antigen biosynthesis protein
MACRRGSLSTGTGEQQPGSRSSGSLARRRALRPRVAGKFIFVGEEKVYIRGVTYGPFRPGPDGCEYDAAVVDRDFAQIAAHGLNAIRTYTVPPRWLLDKAAEHGLWVMVGLAWPQHIAFLDDARWRTSIVAQVRHGVRACAGHPAVLAYGIGNEIPAPIVRWHGRRPIERFLEQLYRVAREEDPEGLVTYVSYPTTEYLQLPFLDFISFNVYLESQELLEAYCARLQNLAGDRPLLMAEIGLDSRRHGEDAQAAAVEWQVRTAFAAGCVGAFVFAWTDEWHRGSVDIEDWDFGLTDRLRRPKRALDTIARVNAEVPFPSDMAWPPVSVVVCTYNGERTLRECLHSLCNLDYPDFEVIVVDDGSTQDIASIARAYPVRYIRTENRGLSSARNTGLAAARGEIVAYIDDDAYADAQWLTYLAATFLTTSYAGIGGPNLPPPGDGTIARCVADAPGGPVHVLLSDREAEHIPGCNMAFRKSALESIGGFDTQFRVAGDDVDLCWRLQAHGWKLGFSPAAVVWHHRRNSVRAYWKQQRGYGKAEAQLERKWPEKYNEAGHIPWAGRIYASYLLRGVMYGRQRIYHGTWGSAPFQSIYQPAPFGLHAVVAMPEWYLIVASLGAVSALGLLWPPLLLLTVTLFVLSLIAPAILAGVRAASVTTAVERAGSRSAWLRRWALTAALHYTQPIARLWGRLQEGLTPWRSGTPRCFLPLPWRGALWTDRWQSPEARLQLLEATLRRQRAVVLCGGEFDSWDLEVRGGLLGTARVCTVVEEHGSGRQLMRVRATPHFRTAVVWATLLGAGLAAGAFLDGQWIAGGVLAGLLATAIARTASDCASAPAAVARAVRSMNGLEAASSTQHAETPGNSYAAPAPAPEAAHAAPRSPRLPFAAGRRVAAIFGIIGSLGAS